MTEPMYRQIADALQRDIDSGQLAPGGQIPTEAELRQQFGRDGQVSRNTVRDAIKLLVSKGLLETRPGQGTFVVDRAEPILTTVTFPSSGGAENPGRSWKATDPRVEIQQASEEVAQQLQLDPGTQVISRHQERRIDSEPWSLQTTFYPMEYFKRGATRLIEAIDIPESVVTYLEKTLGIKEVRRHDTITARAPDRNEAAFFGLPDDGRVPMLDLRRTGFDQADMPVRVTVTVFATDRSVLAYELGKPSARTPDPGQRRRGEQDLTPGEAPR